MKIKSVSGPFVTTTGQLDLRYLKRSQVDRGAWEYSNLISIFDL